MASQKAVQKTNIYGVDYMITHGLLTEYGTIDNLIHEIKTINKSEAKKTPRTINWNKTKVGDNSNRSKKAIYLEDWR